MKIITKKLGEKYHKKKGVVKVRMGGKNGKVRMGGFHLVKGAGGWPSQAILILLKNHVLGGGELCLGFFMVPEAEFIISGKMIPLRP